MENMSENQWIGMFVLCAIAFFGSLIYKGIKDQNTPKT